MCRPALPGPEHTDDGGTAPTAGRMLAGLATTGATTSDVSAFAADRPARRRPDYRANRLA